MNEQTEQQVDQNELRTHQLMIQLGLLAGFVTDRWEWVAAQAIVFLLTILFPKHGPYVLFYHKVLKPMGLLKNDIRVDIPQAHRFAMSIGFLVTGISSYLLYNGYALTGWALVWLVIILGFVAFMGWCAGCFSYFMLNRLGLGGFFKHKSLNGVFPGARPNK